MKTRANWLCGVVVCLFLAPALFAQSLASGNQSAASPVSSVSTAEVPRLIKFSGALLDEQGQALKGPVGVTFAFYAQQTGGAALWVETQNVKPDASGNYTVLLGANSANGVPAEMFVSGEARWLGIQAGQQPEHERILLVSVPYALKAGDAETLGGKPLSSFVLNDASATGSAAGPAAAATSSAAEKTQTAAGAGTKTSATPQAATPCSSVTSDGTATTNSIGLFTTPCNMESSLMSQASINGFPGVNLAGNNAGLLLNGTGTHQVTVTSATTGVSGRLGQDANGFFFASDSNGKAVRFLTNNGTLNEWMRITSAGNVGIGTSSPAATLDVNGSLNLPNTTSGATAGVIRLGGFPFAHNFGPANADNTFVGAFAGNFAMTGNLNTGIGGNALRQNATGFANTAVGLGALSLNTTGHNNTAVGYPAMSSNTDGTSNTAIGSFALSANTSGGDNTAAGGGALQSNTIGSSNTAIGDAALRDNSTGSNNTALGLLAGATLTFANTNTTGSNNTFIGYNSGPGTATQLGNATAIGANALVSASNSLVLGDGTVNVGIGTTTPAAKLDVAGNNSTQILNVTQNGTGPTATFSGAANHLFDIIGTGGQAQINMIGPQTILTLNSTIAPPNAFSNVTFSHSGIVKWFITTNPNFANENQLGIVDGSGISHLTLDPAGTATITGNLSVTGTLSKGGGSFKIDHPLDPANRYLSHSFVESPDMMDIYNGVTVLDGHGQAWVALPDWFEALNGDFRYQLTSIGSPQPRLYVAKEVTDNQFQIAGGKPHGRVCWQVTGIRHDAYANAHRIPVEEQKTGEEAGKYLHPELFGQPPTKSISAVRSLAVPTPSSSTGENVSTAVEHHK